MGLDKSRKPHQTEKKLHKLSKQSPRKPTLKPAGIETEAVVPGSGGACRTPGTPPAPYPTPRGNRAAGSDICAKAAAGKDSTLRRLLARTGRPEPKAPPKLPQQSPVNALHFQGNTFSLNHSKRQKHQKLSLFLDDISIYLGSQGCQVKI